MESTPESSNATRISRSPKISIGSKRLCAKNVVRDRMAIDFFEQRLGKKEFGTLGISRGAINVAVTAGVDETAKI